jgi:hypothetical protein
MLNHRDNVVKTMTIRELEPSLIDKLKANAKKQDKSLNQFVIDTNISTNTLNGNNAYGLEKHIDKRHEAKHAESKKHAGEITG